MTQDVYLVTRLWRAPHLSMADVTVHWVAEIIGPDGARLYGLGKSVKDSRPAPSWVSSCRLGQALAPRHLPQWSCESSLQDAIWFACRLSRYIPVFNGVPDTFEDGSANEQSFCFPVRTMLRDDALFWAAEYKRLTGPLNPCDTWGPVDLGHWRYLANKGAVVFPPRAVGVRGPARRAWMHVFGHTEAILITE